MNVEDIILLCYDTISLILWICGMKDNIDIMVYQNYFMICKDKETVEW